MALPYPTKVVLPFDIATAQDMNERHANDVALAAGSGLDDGAVTSQKLDSAILNYSTSEVNTGRKWVNNKDIYRKTVSFGALPNATQKNVAHGITGIDFIITMEAFAKDPSGSGTFNPIPFASVAAVGSSMQVFVDGSNISIHTGTSNRSNYTTSFITLYYTKS